MKRLKAYDVVLLAPPLWRSSLGQVACHVVAVDADEVALEPLDPDDLARLPVVLPDMFMTFTHDGTLVALKGELMLRSTFKVDKGAAEARDLRFRVTDGVHSPARDGSRLPLCAPIALIPAADEQGSGAVRLEADGAVETQTIHITADRLLVEPLGDAIAPGSLVGVELALPGSDRPLTAVAVVLESDGDGTVVQFRDITRTERARLVTFIFECHREALRLYTAERRLAGLPV